MKILIGLTYYWPNISGVSQYARILAEELAERGNGVAVVCAKVGEEMENYFDKYQVATVRINGVNLGKGFIMPSYWYKSIEVVRWSDVVNCHLPSIESFWLALWAKLFSKKLIVTHHCEFMFSGTLINKIIAVISWPIHFFVYLWADKIIAYTQDYAQHSSFLKMFKNKVIFILPPIKIKPLKHEGQKKLIIGYVGRIAWEKGLERLVDIIPRLKKKIDFEMWWVGPFNKVQGDNYYGKLKNKIVENSQYIKLIGPIDHDKLNQYYRKFDCLVLPSTDNLETFGIVQAEAMINRVPVIASDLPGVRVPIMMTGMGEISSITDNNDLAIKIIKVLTNKNKYIKNAKNIECFDYRKTVDQYEELFKSN